MTLERRVNDSVSDCFTFWHTCEMQRELKSERVFC